MKAIKIIELFKKARKYADYELKDDATDFGGTAFSGETLKDFMESIGKNMNSPMFLVNKWLKECGIEPIK